MTVWKLDWILVNVDEIQAKEADHRFVRDVAEHAVVAVVE